MDQDHQPRISLYVSLSCPRRFRRADDYIAGVLDADAFPSKLVLREHVLGRLDHRASDCGCGRGQPEHQRVSPGPSVALVTAADGVTDEAVGQVKLTLVPAAYDVVDASSPMDLVLSPNALVVIASTSTA